MALLIAALFFLIPYILTKIITRRLEVKTVLTDSTIYLQQDLVFEKRKPAVMASRQLKTLPAESYRIVKKEEIQKQDINKPVDPDPPVQHALIGVPSDSASPATGNTVIVDSVSTEPYSTSALDALPEFPGGEDAMLKYLSKHIRYPGRAKANDITGRVYVSFTVNEDGNIEDIRIINGLGYGTEEEVMRVVAKMPAWKPGVYKGNNVKTAFILPVLFGLK